MMFTNRLNTCLAKTSKLIRIGKIASHKQEDDVQNEHTRLKNHHNLEGNKFEKEYNDKKAEQRALPGADTRDELLAKAQGI